jgi:hypothetical protein
VPFPNRMLDYTIIIIAGFAVVIAAVGSAIMETL